VGGRRIALLDNFTWGNPEKPERLGTLVKACEACYDYARAFRTPFISGKDSLYNESPLGPVTPTLLITALGIVPDIRLTVSMDTKDPGDLIYMVGKTFNELGGSEYYRSKGLIGKIDLGLVKACHDLSEGGFAVAAAEMALAGGYGLDLDLKRIPREPICRNDFILFSESNSRFLVEVSEKAREDFDAIMKGRVYSEIGKVTKTTQLSIHGLDDAMIVETSLSELLKSWKQTLNRET
jgi:phosphoribosylformylglycinamidine synthase